MYQRIKAIMDYEDLSPQQFADKVGIARSGLTHIFSGRNQPSLELVRKILLTFPDINTEWLMMGIGNMTRLQEERKKNLSSNSEDLAMRQFDLFEENISNNIQENIQEDISKNISSPELNLSTRRSISKKISHCQQEKNNGKTIEKQAEAKIPKRIEKIVLVYNNKSFEVLYPEVESE